MSLLRAVEEAIRSLKDEQAKMSERLQLYRDVLHALAPQPMTAPDDSELADAAAAADTDTSPGETEDMKLLEQALEKALRVRGGAELPAKDPARHPKEVAAAVAASNGLTQASAACKGSQTAIKSTSKTTRKEHRRPGTSGSSRPGPRPPAGCNPGRCRPEIGRTSIRNRPASSAGVAHCQPVGKAASDARDRGREGLPAFQSEEKTAGSGEAGGADPGKAATAGAMPPPSVADDTPAQPGGMASADAVRWKNLRVKQNRLWDKVITAQRKPVPGRSRFMERMSAMFPGDWPSGSPDQTRALVGELTHRGHELVYQELLAQRTPEGGTELGIMENHCDPCPTFERLTAAELRNLAGRAKREWEAWDRWRPRGGCLCPAGADGETGDGPMAPLPMTVTYATEAELRELERLRAGVALLRQEISLEQALMDAVSPQLASVVPGCASASVLRDLYSLLGEGGQRFPALVLDAEPE